MGSGVWIGNSGYIATCWHVVKFAPTMFKIGIAQEPFLTEGRVNISVSHSFNVIDAELKAHDEDTDIAIYKAKTPPTKLELAPSVAIVGGPPLRSIIPQTPVTPMGTSLAQDFPTAGEIVLLAGFPLKGDSLILQTGVATGYYWAPEEQGHNTIPSKLLRIMLSVVSNPGNSGGPVLDHRGNLLGLLEGNLLADIRSDQLGVELCDWIRLDQSGQPVRDPNGQIFSTKFPCQQNSGISYAVPARLIQQLAETNNIDLQ